MLHHRWRALHGIHDLRPNRNVDEVLVTRSIDVISTDHRAPHTQHTYCSNNGRCPLETSASSGHSRGGIWLADRDGLPAQLSCLRHRGPAAIAATALGYLKGGGKELVTER